MPSRRVHSIRNELVRKSKEAALNAVQTFNNPLTTFKSESFIVLMVIAWMYLLHAHYRGLGTDYRYYTPKAGRKYYDRTKSGAVKTWELERCLNDDGCPLDAPTKANLRFLIGLRHEIEHQICLDLDDWMAGRYLACCLNFEAATVELLGSKHSMEPALSFTLNFRDLMKPPMEHAPGDSLPARVAAYIQDFDCTLSDDEYNSPKFSVRLLFTQRLVNRRGQADRVVEFVPADSALGEAIEREHWVLKPVEKAKWRASEVVRLMHSEGFPRFGMHKHTDLWKQQDGKSADLHFGVELGGQWFWYENWVAVVREECAKHANVYRPDPAL